MTTLEWIANNHLGDLASLAGVAISIVGFVVAIWNIRRSKSAAERAEKAANDARQMIRVFEAVSDFSAAIAIMEENQTATSRRANGYIARSVCRWLLPLAPAPLVVVAGPAGSG